MGFIHRTSLVKTAVMYALFELSTVSTLAITTIKDISITLSVTNWLCEHRENSSFSVATQMIYLDFPRDGALVSHTWHDRWSLVRVNTPKSKLIHTATQDHKHKGDVTREVSS
jgi:hypothetical protein